MTEENKPLEKISRLDLYKKIFFWVLMGTGLLQVLVGIFVNQITLMDATIMFLAGASYLKNYKKWYNYVLIFYSLTQMFSYIALYNKEWSSVSTANLIVALILNLTIFILCVLILIEEQLKPKK